MLSTKRMAVKPIALLSIATIVATVALSVMVGSIVFATHIICMTPNVASHVTYIHVTKMYSGGVLHIVVSHVNPRLLPAIR